MGRRQRDMTTGEVGNALGVAARTAQKWIDEGHLRGSYVLFGSKDRRVPPQSVLEFAGKHGMKCILPDRYEGMGNGRLVASDDPAVNAVAPITRGTSAEIAWLMCDRIPSLLVLDRMMLSMSEVRELVGLARDRAPFARIIVLSLEDEPESEWERYTPAVVLARPFGPGTLLETLTAETKGA